MDSLNIHMELDLALILGKKLINQWPEKGKGFWKKSSAYFWQPGILPSCLNLIRLVNCHTKVTANLKKTFEKPLFNKKTSLVESLGFL